MTTETQTRTVASPGPTGTVPAERVDFRYHPRLIRALGAELVTSDIVAIIELVKNSYDAFAHNVTIRFAEDADGAYIEILDDGLGMTRDVIEDAWFTVATPHKVSHNTARLGARQRRVSGNKGLGRLSAARLGGRFEMITQAPGGSCWKVDVEWGASTGSDSSGGPVATLAKIEHDSYFRQSGTRIRIYDIHRLWSDKSIDELKNALARLISPFQLNDPFAVTFQPDCSSSLEEVAIESPPFLANPPYRVAGRVDVFGNVNAKYVHTKSGKTIRQPNICIDWKQIYDTLDSTLRSDRSSLDSSVCGPFEFEIRAWDLAPEERQSIADQFAMQKRDVQRAVNSHKGISLYRDGVLVLPKTEQGKDWLELDSRRVKRVGEMIGTRNVIGYVSIGSESNPDIVDTSDRETLAKNPATEEFRSILMSIISRFEAERSSDRAAPTHRLKDVFSAITAENVLKRARKLERRNESISTIIPVIEEHVETLSRTREELRRRFVYYSRVAALGHMAFMLVHEVRNRTTSIDKFLRRVSATVRRTRDVGITHAFGQADGSVNALVALAKKFAPLASRSFKRSRSSVVEHQMHNCVGLLSDSLRAGNIRCEIPSTKTYVLVDPGELTLVLYNLIDNSAYWLINSSEPERVVQMTILTNPGGDSVTIRIRDNGPGISPENEQRVFLPGYTMKPHGTGMGLTVASELVEAWGGSMRLEQDDDTIGACFAFDAPVDSNGSSGRSE